MRQTDKIDKLIKNLKTNASHDLDQRINRLIDSKHSVRIRPLNTWSTMMHHKMTKPVAAAMILIAVIIGMNFLNGTPAWAIEQSIEAMKQYRCYRCDGNLSTSWTEIITQYGTYELPELPDLPELTGPFELWVQADEVLSRSSQMKAYLPSNATISGGKLHSYIELPDGITYDIPGDYMKIDPLADPEGMIRLKELADTWEQLHGIDAETGRRRILVKCGISSINRSWQLEFDAESKLLVSSKQWDSSSCQQGVPTFEMDRFVYYERLPETIFDINLTESRKIITVNTSLTNPDYGISTEGLTQQEACHKIIRQIWQAVNEQNYDIIRKLAPLAAFMNDEQIRDMLYNDPESIILLEMGDVYESALGATVPCIFQINGQIMIIDLVVMFRETDGTASCVVYGNLGQARPLE